MTKHSLLLTTLLVLCPLAALAQKFSPYGVTPCTYANSSRVAASFKAGQRVYVGNLNEYGSVVDVGKESSGNANLVQIHLDRTGPTITGTESWFDPIASRVTPGDDSRNPIPDPSPGGTQSTQATGQAGNQGNFGASGNAGFVPRQQTPPDVRVPDNAPPSEETFKNLIRANYPQESGKVVSLDFTNMQVGSPVSHEAVYARSTMMQGGHGHTYKAYPVHAVFKLKQNYSDPYSPDEVRALEGDYLMYMDVSGHWTAEGQNMKYGENQYIKKR